jgi:hypothetical protein
MYHNLTPKHLAGWVSFVWGTVEKMKADSATYCTDHDLTMVTKWIQMSNMYHLSDVTEFLADAYLEMKDAQ